MLNFSIILDKKRSTTETQSELTKDEIKCPKSRHRKVKTLETETIQMLHGHAFFILVLPECWRVFGLARYGKLPQRHTLQATIRV